MADSEVTVHTNPTTTTTLIFIRHGQTEWNSQHRWQGHKNSPLTEKGETGAVCAGKRLWLMGGVDVVVTSDLGRTLQTTAAITKQFSTETPVHQDKRLREQSLGIMEGHTHSEIDADEGLRAAMEKRKVDPTFVIPGGESKDQVSARFVAAVHEIIQTHQGKRVLIVTHGAALGLFMRDLLGFNDATSPVAWPITMKNTALNVVTATTDLATQKNDVGAGHTERHIAPR